MSTIGVEILAFDPVDRMELWSGGELAVVQVLGEAARSARTAIEWVPERSGIHALTVRAFDTTGWVATSPPLWMRVDDPGGLEAATHGPDGDIDDGQPAAEGLLRIDRADGPTGFASRSARPTDVGAAMPSQADSSIGPLTVGPIPEVVIDPGSCEAVVEVPDGTVSEEVTGITLYATAMGAADYEPVGAVARTGGSVRFPVGSAPVIAYAESYGDAIVFPGAPVVAEPPADCAGGSWSGDVALSGGVLTGADPVDQGYLYMSTDAGATWMRVPSDDQTFVTPQIEGGALDFTGLLPPLQPGAQALVEAWGWSGGQLRALGRGTWQPDTTMLSPDDAGGFGGLWVPPVSDLDWAWSVLESDGTPTGGASLHRSGTICTYPPPKPGTGQPNTPTVIVSGDVATTTSTTTPPTRVAIGVLPSYCSNYPLGQYPKTFRWRPAAGAIDGGLVQVSTRPIPSGPVSDFPGLVFTSAIPAPEGDVTEFKLPLAQIIDPPEITAGTQAPKEMTFTALDDLTSALALPERAVLTGDLVPEEAQFIGLDNVAALYADPPPPDDDPASLVLPDLPDTGDEGDALYIRVVPKLGTQLLHGESNVVTVLLSRTAPEKVSAPVTTPGLLLDVGFTPPVVPNSNYSRCVRIVENPFGADNPVDEYLKVGFNEPIMEQQFQAVENRAFVFVDGQKSYQGLVAGATVCAIHHEPSKSFVDSVVDAIATAVASVGKIYDIYVMLYDKLKDLAADLVVKMTGCKQFAELAGASEEDAQSVCKTVASTAITVALAASGVPPSLPSYGELVQLGKGELKDAIAKGVVAATGIDCEQYQEQCEKMLEEVIGLVIDEGEKAMSKAAKQAVAAGDGWSLWLNGAIKVIPEPVAGPPTAVFRISLTRSADPDAAAPPTTCSYTANVWGSKEQYTWTNYTTGKSQTGPIDAPVMKPETLTLDLTGLAPGETIGGTIVLDELIPFFPPGQHPHQAGVPYQHDGQSPWMFFTNSAGNGQTSPTQIEMMLSSSTCGSTISNPYPQDGDASFPYDVVPYP